MTIQYLYKENEEACFSEPLRVRLDGVECGEIRSVQGGFQYFPKGMKSGGAIFETVAHVQQSLSE